MKKIKFFAMALAALAIVSCSKEIGTNNGDAPVVEGQETYATFSFNVEGGGPGTKGNSVVDGGADVAGEAYIKDISIAIFNNKGFFELLATPEIVNAKEGIFPTTPIKLSSGVKTFFVFANSKETPNFPKLVKDESTLAHCYGSKISLMTGDLNSFNIQDIVGQEKGYYMSSIRTASSTKTLIPGVTSGQSAAGDESMNNFVFKIQRAVSKVTAKLKDDKVLTVTPNAKLSNMAYTVRNINKSITPVQLFTVENIVDTEDALKAGTPMAAFFNEFDNWTIPPTVPVAPAKNLAIKENFYPYYDRTFAIDQPLVAAAVVDPDKPVDPISVFVTENTNARQVIGNTSYLAIKGTYTPTKVVKKCKYKDELDGVFYEFADATGIPGASFWKVDLAGLNKIGGVTNPLTNNLFSDIVVATEILEGVLTANGFSVDGTKDKNGVAITDQEKIDESKKLYEDEFAKRLLEYTNGVTYYRLNIGRTDGIKTVYGIRRNSKYAITINSISTLGVNTEGGLDENPEIPVSSQETFVTATIKILPWDVYTQDGDL